jgi:uncharacterized protein YqfA (UPF0365 family)
MDVAGNPDHFLAVTGKGLDANTAFGNSVDRQAGYRTTARTSGAKVIAEQAEGRNAARRRRGIRRVGGPRQEQENIAEDEKSGAGVLAEAEIPKAMAEAFRNGTSA